MNASRETGRSHARRPYCLGCYAPMEPFAGASHACERCGFVNVKLDQELFWTKEKQLSDLEGWAKTVIVFLVAGIALLIPLGFASHPSFGTGQGWAVAFPILFGALLWETASKITRRKPYFRATIVWRIVFALVGVPCLLLVHDLWREPRAGFVALALGVLLLTAALGLGRLGRAAERWRERRILAGQISRADS